MAYPLKAREELDEATGVRRAPIRMSYEQFLESGEDFGHAEWVDGEVIVMSPASDRHEDIEGFLYALIRCFAEARALGVVRGSRFQMKTAPGLPGREPDILFVAESRRPLIKRTHLDGAADLVVEIVSPESSERDRVEKFAEYERGGVREYWIIDPEQQRAEFCAPGADGRFQAIPLGGDGFFRSGVLQGLWLDPAWLWAAPLPPVMKILKLWEIA